MANSLGRDGDDMWVLRLDEAGAFAEVQSEEAVAAAGVTVAEPQGDLATAEVAVLEAHIPLEPLRTPPALISHPGAPNPLRGGEACALAVPPGVVLGHLNLALHVARIGDIGYFHSSADLKTRLRALNKCS